MLSDIAQFFEGDPVLLWLFLTIIPIAVWALYKHQRPKYVIKWFLNYKIFTFATLFTIIFLVANALIGSYAHYSAILFAGGMVCALMFVAIVEPALRKKQDIPRLVKVPRGWAFIGLVAGTFAVAGAWQLFGNITTREGWITFALLIVVGATFLLRAVIAFNFHIWLPTFVATFTATNMPSWINPSIGGVVELTQSTIFLITAVVTVAFWVILTLILLWLYHLETFINRILNSPPLLFVVAVSTIVWAAGMVVYTWQI